MKSILFLILLIFSFTSTVYAQERVADPDRARSIFEEMENRRNSIKTEKAELQMVITDSRGRTRNRTLQSWSENDGDDSKSLILFSAPGNVRGTGFLSIDEDGNQTQRLFLPSIGRIQTISSAERGDQFMGSDFTYEDLGSQNSEDYEFDWLEINDQFYTIRATAIDSEQYTSIEFDILKETYSIKTVRYFNQANQIIKRLESEQFEQLSENHWSPSIMTMFDLREDRKTELTWSNRETNVQIEDWRFTERGLRRGL
tara:strand:- start:19426 stop:20196 length:771 start_codon:yes stop_codon:yes gene_type:complete